MSLLNGPPNDQSSADGGGGGVMRGWLQRVQRKPRPRRGRCAFPSPRESLSTGTLPVVENRETHKDGDVGKYYMADVELSHAELKARAAALASSLNEHSHYLVHCQDFLVANVWDRVPKEWQLYLEQLSFIELANLPIEPLPNDYALPPPDSLRAFLACSFSLHLPRQPSTKDAGSSNSGVDAQFVGVLRPTAKGLRRAKKSHEVERLAALVASIVNGSSASGARCARALDVGCGKGNLVAELAALGLDVVGIEAQAGMLREASPPPAATTPSPAVGSTIGGRRRTWQRTILADEHAGAVLDGICAEAWPQMSSSSRDHDVESADGDNVWALNWDDDDGEDAACSACDSSSSTRGGGGGSDIDQDDEGVVLCALHACGDLSPTIIRGFASAPRFRALAVVPCCYNMLTVADDPCGKEHVPMRQSALAESNPCEGLGARVPFVAKAAAPTAGFPLSDAVKATGLVLTRDARMVATQREAASLPPSWLEEAKSVTDRARDRDLVLETTARTPSACTLSLSFSSIRKRCPAPILGQLFICLFASLARSRFADLVPAGTRLSTGGHRRHRRAMATQSVTSGGRHGQSDVAPPQPPQQENGEGLRGAAASPSFGNWSGVCRLCSLGP